MVNNFLLINNTDYLLINSSGDKLIISVPAVAQTSQRFVNAIQLPKTVSAVQLLKTVNAITLGNNSNG